MIDKNPERTLPKCRVRCLVVLLAFVSIFLAACTAGPGIKMPERVRPITGIDAGTEPDATVIHEGVTTRAEIVRQFANFDTGWKGERLFIGRWLRSESSRYGKSDTSREWIGKNLVVNFDEKGTVTNYHVLTDRELVSRENSGLLTAEKHLPEIQQPASGITINIVNMAGKDMLEISGACLKNSIFPRLCPGARYLIAAEQIKGVGSYQSIPFLPPSNPATSQFPFIVHLKKRIRSMDPNTKGTRILSDWTFQLNPDVPTVVRLIYFLYPPHAQ